MRGRRWCCNGDVPLVRAETLHRLLDGAAGSVACWTVRLADPTGYGRIVRRLARQRAEDRRAVRTPPTRNGESTRSHGTWSRRPAGSSVAGQASNDNAQQEYYLTDDLQHVAVPVAHDSAVSRSGRPAAPSAPLRCRQRRQAAGAGSRRAPAARRRTAPASATQSSMRGAACITAWPYRAEAAAERNRRRRGQRRLRAPAGAVADQPPPCASGRRGRRRLLRGGDHAAEHRPPRHRMQYLWQGRAHALALARPG